MKPQNRNQTKNNSQTQNKCKNECNVLPYRLRQANKLRQRLRNLRGRRSAQPLPHAILAQNTIGQLWFKLPATAAAHLCAKPGMRVWWAVTGKSVSITRRPTGPMPPGRRSSSRIKRVAKP